MARASTGRGKKARKKSKKKRKVAVSPKPQAGTMPFHDTSNQDVANEIAGRRRSQTAAQQSASPGFPGNIPSETTGSAAGAGNARGAGATLAGEGSLVADATVITAYGQMLARLAELEATVAQLLPLLSRHQASAKTTRRRSTAPKSRKLRAT
jgi:hypothetical protein